MMKTMSLRLSATLAGIALGLGGGVANADVIFSTGNQQFTQVNINADITTATPDTPLTAYINDTAHTPFYFANPMDASGVQIPYLHGSHGAAAVEALSCFPGSGGCATNESGAQVPFYQMDLYVTDPTVGITGMDWALDAYPFGTAGAFTVQFSVYATYNSSTPLALDPTVVGNTNTFTMTNGQNQFFSITSLGESFQRLHITVTPLYNSQGLLYSGLSDIKQVSVEGTAIGPNIPEPGTLALLGVGLVGLAASRKRRSEFSLAH